MPKKVENTSGYLTNCNKCYVTCHNPCAYQNDADKVNCAAMDYTMPAATRSCTVCPEKCIWNLHANQPYRWEYVTEKQATSSDAIKKKYEEELNKKLTAETDQGAGEGRRRQRKGRAKSRRYRYTLHQTFGRDCTSSQSVLDTSIY